MQVQIQPLYRLFFALKPPPVVARQIDHFAEGVDPDAQRIRIDHQHVTLGITADWSAYPYERIKALRRAATGIMAEPFDLMFDRLSLGGRSAALRPSHSIAGLKQLQHQVVDAMRRADIMMRPDWSFSPHQTLFYREGPPAQRPIEGFGWRVDEVALVCSHVGRTRHELIGSWPLRGSAQYDLF
ncbi:2'-5' RNA ligase [Sphingobium lactosutens]|uniref:2'-5' RNA ligase family protein n=1 Tax=Sphingobium lactosutens TaxID=522773 RepID=UPI0015BCCC87|nr:2'-5' RNA ligase family protein [Sphingobium lactosutens]NWK95108.1 2'-5' RNA ligase [Sphingobium lactosutens]